MCVVWGAGYVDTVDIRDYDRKTDGRDDEL